jgi:hypothetical protein
MASQQNHCPLRKHRRALMSFLLYVIGRNVNPKKRRRCADTKGNPLGKARHEASRVDHPKICMIKHLYHNIWMDANKNINILCDQSEITLRLAKIIFISDS